MRKILNSLGARCPNCSEKLDLREVVDEVFRRILERVRDGSSVLVPGFGKFKSRMTTPREVNCFQGNVYSNKRVKMVTKPKRYMTFRTAGKAKKFIRGEEE